MTPYALFYALKEAAATFPPEASESQWISYRAGFCDGWRLRGLEVGHEAKPYPVSYIIGHKDGVEARNCPQGLGLERDTGAGG